MKMSMAASALAMLMFAHGALAGPDESIATTYADEGLRQIDFKFGSIAQSSQARLSAATFGFGYGLTEHWFSEIYVSYERTGSDGTHVDAYSWQNSFLLTNGQYPMDVGLYTEIEHPQDRSEGYEITFGPLLQTEFGLIKLNAALLFQRNYRADFSNPIQLHYQWQLKRRWMPGLEFGLQGFGELGQWDHWAPRSEQSHRLGPAIFGKMLFDGQQLNYNAAILIDASDSRHSTTFRTQVVFGF
jgi:hypothetical protein